LGVTLAIVPSRIVTVLSGTVRPLITSTTITRVIAGAPAEAAARRSRSREPGKWRLSDQE
jgi:hypothetical protein